ARQEIEGSGLAGAVRADERVQRAVSDREIDAIDGVNAAEPFDQTARDQHRRLAGRGAAIHVWEYRLLRGLASGHGRRLDRAFAERPRDAFGDAHEPGRREYDEADEQQAKIEQPVRRPD